jgi:tetratricopeptide (TPR) repeat protein
VLLLLTTRPGLPDDELALFSRMDHFRRIELERLGARDVIELLRESFRSTALAERLGGKIAHRTDGVPFFIFETIRGLRESNCLTPTQDGALVETRPFEEMEVPSAVRDIIEARLRVLPRERREILDLAAVQGYEFDADLIARVEECPRIRILKDLAALERGTGVVRGAGRLFRFDHHQIQELLYQDLHEALRAEYHTALAGAVLEREGLDPEGAEAPVGETAALLARHHLLGSRPEAAVPLLEPALEHLAGTYRYDAALRLSELALCQEGLLEGEARLATVLRRADIFDRLGRRDEQEAAVEEAVALAGRIGTPGACARAYRASGMLYVRSSRHEPARDALREAIRCARNSGERDIEASALAHLGSVYGMQHRIAPARKYLLQAIELARESGDRNLVINATGNLGILSLLEGDYDDAERRYREALEIACEEGDRLGEGLATQRLGTILHEHGRVEEGREHYERALAIFREVGFREHEGVAAGSLSNSYLALGRLEEALAWLERSQLIFEEIGDRMGIGTMVLNRGWIYTELGEIGKAREQFETCLEIGREIEDAVSESHGRHGLAWVAWLEGDREHAFEIYEEAVEAGRRIQYRYGVATLLEEHAGNLVEAGRVEEAEPLAREAVELARELDLPSILVLALCHLAAVPGGDVEAARKAYAEVLPRLRAHSKVHACWLLFELTSERPYLETAHRLLTEIRAGAPAEYRDRMIENVPLHRRIMAAWEKPLL